MKSFMSGFSAKKAFSSASGTYSSKSSNLKIILKYIKIQTIIAIAPPAVSNTSNDVDIIIQDIIHDINGLLYMKLSKNILYTLHGLL